MGRALLLAATTVVACLVPPSPEAAARQAVADVSYRAPRTSWGDPDLQGNYTNKYEQSTPMERPDEFAARRRADITGAELPALLAARNQRVLTRPEAVGPVQFCDTLAVTKASLVCLL